MNMAGMNPTVGGGPVGGNMMMTMNNTTGSPAMQNNSSPVDTTKLALNTYIYEYFLKVGLYDIARALVNEEKFDMRTNPKQSPGRRKDGEINGADGDAMDMDGKDDIPDDLPRPSNMGDSGQQSSGFLFEWFAVFSDIFQAHRSQGKMQGQLTHANQYLLHHQQLQRFRESQQNQSLNRPGMPNQFMQGRPMRQNGMVNGGKLTPQQMQLVQSKQMQQQQQQQQMQRDAHADGDPNARPGTPADGENGGSPSKRPRLGDQSFNGGMMPNGRPGVPVAQQNMMIQAGFTPGMNQAAQFRPNGAMPPKNMAGVANGMIGMTNAGSPMIQAMNQFPDGIPADMYPARPMGQAMPGGPNGQSGNHALQDYQMQLMLLEQQNKKRLMMARQEQHENTNPRDGQPMPGGVNMPPGVSPSGSRTGTSPNPTEQMKRNPQLGGVAGSPSAGDMQGRSPAPMSFMNGMQPQDFNNAALFMKDNPQMMGGPGGPNMRPPTAVEMSNLNRQQQARMGNQFPQGGQPMTQQPSQGQPQPVGTPGQRNEMPPPSAPAAGNSAQRNNQPASPANSNAPPTPSQTSKPNPKAKKGKEDTNKKRPQKKGSTTSAPNAEDPPATPTPSTPITPVHANSFNSTGKGGPNVAQSNQQHQQNQAMQPNQQQMQQPDVNQSNQYPDFAAPDPAFNLDFSTLENADVLENFDFDTFLNTSADDAFNFDGSMGVEGFGMDASDQ